MSRSKKQLGGFSTIEVAVVVVLLGIFAALSLQAVMLATDTYVTSVRNYLEIFREGKTALEKMVREIRESAPSDITIGDGSIQIAKKEDHATPEDPALVITFIQSGDTIERQSATGNFTLAENVEEDSFAAAQDETTDVVTIAFTLSRGETSINLETSVLPRQPEE